MAGLHAHSPPKPKNFIAPRVTGERKPARRVESPVFQSPRRPSRPRKAFSLALLSAAGSSWCLPRHRWWASPSSARVFQHGSYAWLERCPRSTSSDVLRARSEAAPPCRPPRAVASVMGPSWRCRRRPGPGLPARVQCAPGAVSELWRSRGHLGALECPRVPWWAAVPIGPPVTTAFHYAYESAMDRARSRTLGLVLSTVLARSCTWALSWAPPVRRSSGCLWRRRSSCRGGTRARARGREHGGMA